MLIGLHVYVTKKQMDVLVAVTEGHSDERFIVSRD